jgi:nucleoside-diphosphate-sugar epimerase
MMQTAVVFGGAGQLGAPVAEHLLALGWRVAIVTRDGRKLPGNLTNAGVAILDGTGKSRASILNEFDNSVDAVFDPTAYSDADAEDLLTARTRCGGIVVVSSSSVYADSEGRSLDEAAQTGFPQFAGPMGENTSTVVAGSRTYSTRKVAMENVLLASDASVTILRPCAIYGAYATHPREWWFIKRSLDGRPTIPVAYGARSVFHTSSARGIATLAALCMSAPQKRILNVADPTPLSVEQIGAAIAGAAGMPLRLEPFDGPPIGPSRIGGTPWSTERPFVLDTSQAKALGWDGGGEYRERVVEVCRWVLHIARTGDWRQQFTMFARYGYNPFDYEAEDAVLAST